MALIFADGFNYIEDGYELAKWDDYFNEASVDFAAGYGRRGEWGMRISSSSSYYLTKNFSAELSTIIFGAAFKVTVLSSNTPILRFLDAGSPQIEIRAMPDGSIGVYRYNNILLGTSAIGLIGVDNWFYLEVKAVFNNTTGSVEVRLNGDSTPIINLTNQDTCYTVNEYTTSISLRTNVNSNYVYVDDLYVCDTTGTENNDFLGDIKITPLYPISDGNSSDFTRSAGATNYENVDEAQLVNETDYNYSSTINHKDLYGITNFSAAGTILAVQVNAAVINTDTGGMKVRPLSRSGGTPVDNEGDDFNITTSIKIASHIFEQEPTDSVAWTAAKINAAEFGLKIQA